MAAALGSFFAAIPPTIVAYAAYRQGRSNGQKADEAAAKVEIVKEKSDALDAKLQDVHQAVNGGWAELKQKLNDTVAQLATATAEIKALKAHGDQVGGGRG